MVRMSAALFGALCCACRPLNPAFAVGRAVCVAQERKKMHSHDQLAPQCHVSPWLSICCNACWVVPQHFAAQAAVHGLGLAVASWFHFQRISDCTAFLFDGAPFCSVLHKVACPAQQQRYMHTVPCLAGGGLIRLCFDSTEQHKATPCPMIGEVRQQNCFRRSERVHALS